MRRRYRWLLGLIVVVSVPYYWLLVDNRPGSDPGPRFDLAELRRRADAIPGSKPETVQMRTIGWRRVPGALFVAGGGLKRNLIGIESYTLRGPWGAIVIDSGLGKPDADTMGLERFLPSEQAKVDAEMRAARLVVFTHEHLDHLNGFLRSPAVASIARHAIVTPEQGPAGKLAGDLAWTRQSRAAVRPFAYRGYAAVAPGVVLIRTPGHTPGSQMIFVQLANGREYLFAGDTATMARSWQQLRARSRLVGDLLVGEDRASVFGWLKAIRALKRENPALTIIAGHDPEYFTASKHNHGVLFDKPGQTDRLSAR